MATIQYLEQNDFQVLNGHLCVNIEGILLVMFTASNCAHCKRFVPEFMTLPKRMNGIKFGLCSLDGPNRAVAIQSQQTSTQISDVPRFYLYNQGRPVAEYTGARNIQSIISFIEELLPQLQHSFMQQRRTRQPQQSQQPQPQRYERQQNQQESDVVRISPETGVKEYRTSYGRPYNSANEKDFLEYERAYLNKK